MLFADNNGVKIHYKIEGKGTPLILQHGFTDRLEEWYGYSYVNSLKNDYQLILIDLRGHGLSDKPHDSVDYSMKILCSDVIAVLDEIEVDKVHFWGYSMGGYIGFGLTKYFPDRFLSFILGGITPQKVDEDMKERVVVYRTLYSKGPEHFLSAIKKRGNIITPEMEKEIRTYDFKALYAFWDENFFEEDFSNLENNDTPILLYTGEKDEWDHYPRAKEAVKLYSTIKLVTIPDEGHGVQSKKELILPHVLEFLVSSIWE